MGVAHVGLVHRDPCECKVKGFRAVSFIERNVSKRRHMQGVRQCACACLNLSIGELEVTLGCRNSIIANVAKFVSCGP